MASKTYELKCKIARDLRAGIDPKVIARHYSKTLRYVEIIQKELKSKSHLYPTEHTRS